MTRYAEALAVAAAALVLGASIDARAEFGQNSYSRSSRLVYRDACGWQGSGRVAYVENSTRRSASVTVRETYSSGRERRTTSLNYSLWPGDSRRVGCTRGDTSVEFRSFSIVSDRAGR
jgi:hypothetical protein